MQHDVPPGRGAKLVPTGRCRMTVLTQSTSEGDWGLTTSLEQILDQSLNAARGAYIRGVLD